MYVNTLITLQENLTTYAVEGKKVSGHVTVNSPGMIKCYVQNLKGQELGHKYAFYVFSKTHNKAIRLGELGKNKETHWIVSEKNVEGSGIKLEDLDAAAVVAENNMRGADTIAMGFKNSRYMIIPLIDDIVKKIPSAKSVTASNNTKTAIKPDYIQKGKSPIKAQELNTSGGTSTSATGQGGYNNSFNTSTSQNGNMSGSSTGNANNTNSSQMPEDQGEIMSIYNQPGSSNTETGAYYGDQAGAYYGDQADATNGQGQSMNFLGGSSNQNGASNNINGQMNQGQMGQSVSQTMTDDDLEFVSQEEMQMVQNSNGMASMNGQNNDNTVAGMSEGLEESDFVKSPIIIGNEFEQISAEQNLEDEESELLKIAEKLKETEKNPGTYKYTGSGVAQGSTGTPNASIVRDETVDEALEKTSQELRSIIERLSSNGEVRDKIENLKNEIEKLSELSRSYKEDEKNHLEKTLEERYVAKQRDEQEAESELTAKEEPIAVSQGEISKDDSGKLSFFGTVPREAISFIKNCIEKVIPQENEAQSIKKEPILDKKRSIQEEVDYISEIDKKIQEIEERRKREREQK